MSEDNVYIRYGQGVLTVDCVFKDEIIFDNSLFQSIMQSVFKALNIPKLANALKKQLLNTASVNSYTKTSAEIDVADPDNKILATILKFRVDEMKQLFDELWNMPLNDLSMIMILSSAVIILIFVAIYYFCLRK